MKPFWLAFLLLLPAVLNAEPVDALTQAHGVAFVGMFGRPTFGFKASYQECQSKFVSDLVVYQCKAAGSNAVFTGTQKDHYRSFDFTTVRIMIKSYKGRSYVDYTFTGQHTETEAGITTTSPVSLTLWYYYDTPKEIMGSVEIPGFGITGSIRAEP